MTRIKSLELERQATALAWASRFGLASARERFDVKERTFRNWRARLASDAELRELYERKRQMLDAVAVDDAACVAADPKSRLAPAPRSRPRALVLAVKEEVAACARLAGLPPVASALVGFVLSSNQVVDLALAHSDERITLCAVSSRTYSEAAYQLIGRLLFYYEGAPEGFRASGDVRLVVFADHDAPLLWERAVAHLDLEVSFVNVSEVVGPRLEENRDAA